MPTTIDKDALTGKTTTGHEWDGIKELNTPLPKWWLYVLYATIVWSAVWWLLYPSWPWFTGYFGGILGANQRLELAQRLAVADAQRAQYLERIRAASLDEIAQDPELAGFALAGGAAAFADNCAPCHGLGGAGQGFYPSLADDAWIWGGTVDDIHATILYGIRSGHEQTRLNEMPAFGALGMLTRDEINVVAEHVLSLSGQSNDANAAARGAGIFAEQCASCHGEQGEGLQEMGGPALDDAIWQYGGSKEAIVAQIHSPRHGVMPAWVGRLDAETIKILATYVHSLGGGQ
jgi:cytochrome c oxidase cbb3-type subunit III